MNAHLVSLPNELYFIGIGGTGMSALATIAFEMGYQVSGSDIFCGENTCRLQEKGIQVFIGHSRERIKNISAVVISSAIPPENVELQEAIQRNIPIIHRGEMLAFFLNQKKGIAIAGTHGKTTTTSMISLLLEVAGLDPTVLVGGEVEDIGGNARFGDGEYFVSEADESDGSFLRLSPYCAVITNIEDDHLEYYGSQENEMNAFVSFTNGVKEGGFIVACGDHPNVQAMFNQHPQTNLMTYGMINDRVDVHGSMVEERAEGSLFRVTYLNQNLGSFILNIPGLHNVINSLACVAVGVKLGIDKKSIASALEMFKGVKRRYERIGYIDGTLVVDDYAHHPTEMSVVLRTALSRTLGKVIVVFQPHRYTRTKRLYREMAEILKKAHQVILFPIYSAGEKPIEGITSSLIYDELKKAGYDGVHMVSTIDEALDITENLIGPGNILITMGAGDVWKVADSMCRKNGNQLRKSMPVLRT
ncbi:UDP-N-acetylmuramate--L-alanine ligase [Atribacter laminatus]|uniref:UDP-N-acetylmuramate--L-alanine ligase n=1 Tax=Atribacter laminatus TaxID=2847778 RepID=A0A7T1F1N6_ATRLM|nr:UDP-N-acetylmuramate--L-alanine ligase [Atribacter laminatus]QPM66930.1 UDP-N-acetylmuramate--L-alanine ligase [Atribacter laminatus]